MDAIKKKSKIVPVVSAVRFWNTNKSPDKEEEFFIYARWQWQIQFSVFI